MSRNSLLSVTTVFVVVCATASLAERPTFLSVPTKPVIFSENDDVILSWTFRYPLDVMEIHDVAFGMWRLPGYVNPKLLVINANGSVVKRSGFSWIHWTGDIKNSIANFTLCRLSKNWAGALFGIHVEFGLQHIPLKDVVELRLRQNITFVRHANHTRMSHGTKNTNLGQYRVISLCIVVFAILVCL